MADRDRAMRTLADEKVAQQRRMSQLEQRIQQLLKQHPAPLASPKMDPTVDRTEPETKRKAVDIPGKHILL